MMFARKLSPLAKGCDFEGNKLFQILFLRCSCSSLNLNTLSRLDNLADVTLPEPVKN